MNINYDKVADAVYVNVAPGAVVKTTQVNNHLNIDVDSDGNIVGIELLDASAHEELVKGLESSVRNGVPVSISSATPTLAVA